ncbi:glycosyltransferase, partial [Streptomyces tendae]
MKALHIITGLGVGGAEQQLRLILRHLPVDCDVVTLTRRAPGHRQLEERPGLRRARHHLPRRLVPADH